MSLSDFPNSVSAPRGFTPNVALRYSRAHDALCYAISARRPCPLRWRGGRNRWKSRERRDTTLVPAAVLSRDRSQFRQSVTSAHAPPPPASRARSRQLLSSRVHGVARPHGPQALASPVPQRQLWTRPPVFPSPASQLPRAADGGAAPACRERPNQTVVT